MMSEDAINALATEIAKSYVFGKNNSNSVADYISLFLDTRDLAHEMIVQRERRVQEKSNTVDTVKEARSHFL